MTIVEAYRNLTGLKTIPKNKQYWTLCGPMTNQAGLQDSCEMNQILTEGLIQTPSQFHGVEKVPAVYRANLQAVQRLKIKPRLYLGEFHSVMSQALAEKRFAPAIVNLDTLYEPRRAVRLLGETLHLLNSVSGPLVVVLNTVLELPHWGVRATLNDLTQTILEDPFCCRQLNRGWMDSTEGFVYSGTGRTNVKMGTAIYFKR